MELEAFDPLVPALIFLVIGTIIGHLFFFWLAPRPETFWKTADFVAIAIAGLELVSVSADLREESAANDLELAKDRAAMALRDIGWAIGLVDTHVYCAPLWRDQDPAAAAEYEAVCEWGKQAAITHRRIQARMIRAGEYTPLDRSEFEDPPALITDVGKAGWEFEKQVDRYIETVQDMRRLEREAVDNSFEGTLRFFAPF